MNVDARGGTFSSLGRDQNFNYHIDSRSHHAPTTINIAIHTGSASGSSLQNFVQTLANASNGSPIETTKSSHQQAMMAADHASGLIVAIVQLIVNRTESSDTYRGLKQSLELLNHAILMARLALQTFEYTPLGRHLAITIKPTVIDCRNDLQELSDKLYEYREGLSFTGIRDLWGHVLSSGAEGNELASVKSKLLTHQGVLGEFLAALNSYVQQTHPRQITR